jgi:hypothetical protein
MKLIQITQPQVDKLNYINHQFYLSNIDCKLVSWASDTNTNIQVKELLTDGIGACTICPISDECDIYMDECGGALCHDIASGMGLSDVEFIEV